MSNISRSHENAIVVTPATLKQQIIIRLNTLVNKAGGGYYFQDDDGYSKPITEIDGVEIHGIETKGRELYLMTVSTDPDVVINNDDDEGYVPYNANEFYIEQLWQVYLGCEPLYQSRFNDYALFQD